jgi:hypothetical protein
MENSFKSLASKENLKKAYEIIKKEVNKSTLSTLPINNPGITAIDNLGDNFFDSLSTLILKGEYKPE